MNKQRLEALAEGIFAIVMTLLVIEIQVPEIHHTVTNYELFEAIAKLTPLFLSYILSFLVLATFWRAHVFMISYYTKEIDNHVININILFFMLIGLIPFSSHLLGTYPESQFAVIWYGINISMISISLYILRIYLKLTKKLDFEKFNSKDRRYSRIRLLIPLISTILVIPISFWNTSVSIFIYTFIVLFNFFPGGIVFFEKLFSIKQSK